MLGRAIMYFISVAASYLLFYFNVPYWTGRDMADMSASGIWRALFRFLAFIGRGVHWVLERLSEGIFRPILEFIQFKVLRGRCPRLMDGIIGFINVLFYTGALWLILLIYNGNMDSFFFGGISELAEGGEGIYGTLSRLFAFVGMLRTYGTPAGGWTVWDMIAAVIVVLLATILYVIINTVFFATLYGLLAVELDEVNVAKKLPFLKKRGTGSDGEEKPLKALWISSLTP